MIFPIKKIVAIYISAIMLLIVVIMVLSINLNKKEPKFFIN